MTEPNQAAAQVVEFTLGPDDLLVLSCEQWLTVDQRDRIATCWTHVLANPGPKVVVLEGGMQLHILHRDAAGAIARACVDGQREQPAVGTAAAGRAMVESEAHRGASGCEAG
ncbi:hypothetical protein ABWU93_11395 [Xanthomonas translucens pv. translucens]|uniref:hypothetical protein n=1 Tax=Xanthomonas campestris pv. translucens TaxID=343 RepID=UPI003F706311